jgi:hypothetical protein
VPRIVGTIFAALVISLVAPAIAHADRWTGADDAGDVEGWFYDPEPEPCGLDTEVDASGETNEDITRLRVRHTRRTMIVTTKFRDLRRPLEQAMSLYVRTGRRGWWLDVIRFRDSDGAWRVLTFMTREPELPDPDDIDGCGIFIILTDVGCRTSHKIDFAGDRFRLVVPRRCMRNPRWVRVAADSDRFVEPEDPDEPGWTTFSDEWDDGVELSPWMPPFGPRVPAAEGALVGSPRWAHARSGERREYFVSPDRNFTRR